MLRPHWDSTSRRERELGADRYAPLHAEHNAAGWPVIVAVVGVRQLLVCADGAEGDLLIVGHFDPATVGELGPQPVVHSISLTATPASNCQ